MVSLYGGFQHSRGKEMNDNLALIRKYTEGRAELSWAGRIAVKAGRKNLEAMDKAIGG
jgi:hypothetical protein